MYSSTPLNPVSFSPHVNSNAPESSGPILMGRAAFSARAEPQVPSLIPLFSSQLIQKAKTFQERFLFWPPEMQEWPCDLHMGNMSEFIGKNRILINRFISDATTAELETILNEVFPRDIWLANQRAFFQTLHDQARQQEASGFKVSKDFAVFYRKRYNPKHVFDVENVRITVSPPPTPTPAPAGPEVHTDVDTVV